MAARTETRAARCRNVGESENETQAEGIERMSVYPPTRLQMASKRAAKLERSDAARKGAATRKANKAEAELPRDGFDVVPANQPNHRGYSNHMWQQFAGLEFSIRLVPVIDPGGIEFAIWGTEPSQHIPLEALADHLQHCGQQLRERAELFRDTFIQGNG